MTTITINNKLHGLWKTLIEVIKVEHYECYDLVFIKDDEHDEPIELQDIINHPKFTPIKVGQLIPVECSVCFGECSIPDHDFDILCTYCKNGKQDKTVKDIQLRQVNYLIDKISTEKLISFMAEFKVSNIDYLLIGRLL